MNLTTSEYFTFNVDSSIFLTGESGSGKSVLQDKIIARMVQAHSPEVLQFVLFDMTVIDFYNLREDHRDYIMQYNTGMASEKPFELLDEMATLSESRAKNPDTAMPLIFILIEECNMPCADQTRFDTALIKINENAKTAKMKLLYSTSRPAQDTISKKLLASFDLILSGRLASDHDANYLGVTFIKDQERYKFLITENK